MGISGGFTEPAFSEGAVNRSQAVAKDIFFAGSSEFVII
jgi:hypothetical protein